MGGVAMLARELGYTVSGSDSNVYPPMSTQLEAAGIILTEGYDPKQLEPAPDCVVIGNAMSRGNPAVEYILNKGIPYMSGPEFVAETVLRERWVLAIAGTHGKTTTTSMVAWILEYAGLKPGFLIGGVPENFGVSARLGEPPFFVIEADEYDTAFFDKRSKFVHYAPRTAVLNNLEFDHADIFTDLDAIKRQFSHLLRVVPGNGRVISNFADANLNDVIAGGCWSPVEHFSVNGRDGWWANPLMPDGSSFEVYYRDRPCGTVEWNLSGQHNISNALAAIAAGRHAGVPPELGIEALAKFQNVKRRMERRGAARDITVYDDFAHHPTAIATTLDGLRKRVGKARVIAVLEPRSNTMKLGVHKETLAKSLADADVVYLYQPANLGWDLSATAAQLGDRGHVMTSTDSIIAEIVRAGRPNDHVLVMSNGGFENIHERLLKALAGNES